MAADINVVVLVGRLTRDCELKSTPQGTSICRFSVAVNRRKRSGDKWEDEVSYFDVSLWGKSAENMSSYLKKGRQVSIQGELRQNRWEQDGQVHSRIEVVANSVQLLSSGNQQGGSSQDGAYQGVQNFQGGQNSQGGYQNGYRNHQQNKASQQPASESDFGGPEAFDDADIPF